MIVVAKKEIGKLDTHQEENEECVEYGRYGAARRQARHQTGCKGVGLRQWKGEQFPNTRCQGEQATPHQRIPGPGVTK